MGPCVHEKTRSRSNIYEKGARTFQTSERTSRLHLLCPVTHLNDSLATFRCTIGCTFNCEHQLKLNKREKTWAFRGCKLGISLRVILTAYLPVYISCKHLPADLHSGFFWRLNSKVAVWMEAFEWLTLKTDNKQIVYSRLGAHSQHQQATVTSQHPVI